MKPIFLTDWYIATETEYQAPEQARLSGKCYGNPRFEDGTIVSPSRVIAFNENIGRILTYSGHVYELGDPDPRYAELVPNAKEKLFEQLSTFPDDPKLI
jgi:hypothetical protein